MDTIKILTTEGISMEEITKKKLQAIACKVRMGVIEGTYCAKSGHPGGSLSISDLLTKPRGEVGEY